MITQALIDNLVPAVFAILTTVIGVVLGYVLSDMAEARRHRRVEQRQAEAMHLLLKLEADRNLNTLRTGWQAVGSEPGAEYSAREKRDLAYRFLKAMPGEFSREALNSQLAHMALLLSPEDINALFAFYDDLRRVSDFYAALVRARTDQQEEMARFQQSSTAGNQPGRGLYSPRQPFDNLADESWDGLAGTVERLLSRGNPLA